MITRFANLFPASSVSNSIWNTRGPSAFSGFSGRMLILALLFIATPEPARAWWEHTLITRAALENMDLSRTVKVESLEGFLKAEGPALAAELEKMEREFQAIPAYPPLPEALRFDPNAEDIRNAFLRAIRVNPETRLLSYVQYVPGTQPANCRPLDYRKITFLKEVDYLKDVPFCSVNAGTMLPARDVIVSGSDEPDYGHDISLFEDNDSDSGNQYKFGIQPFGNPALEYSSQAPFHMGFYHESAVIYAFAGFLKRTFAQFRALQYLRLAQFAFRTGHDYWGYRFLGWGLHYVQDLTMPYHATVMPSSSSAGMIWINLLNTVGVTGPQASAVQLLSNRHLALENFQRNLMLHGYREAFNSPDDGRRNDLKDWPAFEAISDTSRDKDYDFNAPGYIRNIIAGEAAQAAPEIDLLLEEFLPESIAHDPDHIYEGVEENENMYRILLEDGKAKEVTEILLPLFQSAGIHTRNYIRMSQKQ